MPKLISKETTNSKIHPYTYRYECDVCHSNTRWYYTERHVEVLCNECRKKKDKEKCVAAYEQFKIKIHNEGVNNLMDKLIAEYQGKRLYEEDFKRIARECKKR